MIGNCANCDHPLDVHDPIDGCGYECDCTWAGDCSLGPDWQTVDTTQWARMGQDKFTGLQTVVLWCDIEEHPRHPDRYVELREHGRRLGAKAGDTIRGTYRRNGDEMVLDPASVVLERGDET